MVASDGQKSRNVIKSQSQGRKGKDRGEGCVAAGLDRETGQAHLDRVPSRFNGIHGREGSVGEKVMTRWNHSLMRTGGRRELGKQIRFYG
jgi:hypothetical protein